MFFRYKFDCAQRHTDHGIADVVGTRVFRTASSGSPQYLSAFLSSLSFYNLFMVASLFEKMSVQVANIFVAAPSQATLSFSFSIRI